MSNEQHLLPFVLYILDCPNTYLLCAFTVVMITPKVPRLHTKIRLLENLFN